MYLTQWFLTLFSTKIPLELTLRIWDIFFIEGQKILYRIALAILKINQADILKSDYEQINQVFKAYLESDCNIKF